MSERRTDFDDMVDNYDNLIERVADLLEERADDDIWDNARLAVDKVLEAVRDK